MRLIGLLAAGFCLGLYCFFRGFGFLRRYQVLADTPETPVRGVAMGFVEVAGTAGGDETVSSPTTHTPCYFYKIDIDRWNQDSRGGGRWARYASDADGVRFYLQDETGRVLVDAQDAEIDLQDPCQTEVDGGSFLPSEDAATASFLPPTQDALLEYINLVGSGSRTAAFQGADPSLEYRVNPPRKRPRMPGREYAGSPERYRLTEYCIVPGKAYTVSGTCAANPRRHGEQDRDLILKGENESTFLISDQSKADLQSILGWQTGKYIFGGAALSVAAAALLLQSLGWLQVDFLNGLLK
ncbi:MAG TPA: hypothetical protein VG860_00715 [Terriglobia bacterium]|jgi:hypothetical protein|nr:hypothetical protein [Terriglobia bacterium]